ncbi:MAG TPA: hypothetical protein PLT76_03110 [Candidatus Omnitrophota bacterium]|nr:hypothetical protein [Candidatus Omnitrophota bacterium]HPB69062.1 hypothetical protein [Candidatus Omnitrophota bacterium]HQO57693.1 hypothetical protein [Candidatus Omnitrophota bacterium]HQP12818.1 hypothetical protein [Candidatus Omnitrophota bacterium]
MTQQVKWTLGIVAVFVGLILSLMLFRSWYNTKHSVAADEEVMAVVNELNAQLPKMLDDDTRLERIEGGPGKKLVYICTMVNYSSQDISKELFDKEVAPYVKQGLQTDRTLYPLFRKGITIVYRYFGSDGVYISEVVKRPHE